MKTININTLDLLLHTQTIHLIDVRESFEYQLGHVPSAINIPLSQLNTRYNELDKQTPYYIICQSGMRSAQACHFLETQGYDVTNVLQGTSAWKNNLETN